MENQDPRVYLAAERTFLAWIRTGLSLMGFGFVVARFGLFLNELQAIQPNLSQKSYSFSTWIGTSLVVLGVFVNLFSGLRYIHQVQELNKGVLSINRPSFLAIAVALLLGIVGSVMAIYLVWVR
ncbi:MAG: YidH family protein [Nitrospiria bacterium]